MNFIKNKILSILFSLRYYRQKKAFLKKYRKNKHAYKYIRWTKEQQREFDEFWVKNYGRKIPNIEHRLIQSISGVFNPKFFPDFLYLANLETKMNPYCFSKVISNKGILDILVSEENVRTPKTFLKRVNGCYYKDESTIITYNDALDVVSRLESFVIKPASDSDSGRGVKVFEKSIGVGEIKPLFANYKNDFIVQELIKQHEMMKKINPVSANTLRIFTYVSFGKVYCSSVSFRTGTGSSKVDNIHSGGFLVAVNDDGRFHDKALRIDENYNFYYLESHPNTNVFFKDCVIKNLENIKNTLKRLHGRFIGINIISWDVMIDEEGKIVIIEVNLDGQSLWTIQFDHGKPIFGNQTEDIISEYLL